MNHIKNTINPSVLRKSEREPESTDSSRDVEEMIKRRSDYFRSKIESYGFDDKQFATLTHNGQSQTTTAQAVLARYMAKYSLNLHGGRGLYLYGDTGTGKSFMIRILNEWTGTISSYFTARNMIQLAKNNRQSFEQLFEHPVRYSSTHGDYYRDLIIDDFGTEESIQYGEVSDIIPFVLDRFFELKERCRNWKQRPALFMTSNIHPENLDKPDNKARVRYDDRVVSRIKGMVIPVHITGNDRRLTL